MRILELISPTNIGGAENYVADLSRTLRDKGHEVFLLSGNPSNKKNPSVGVLEFFRERGINPGIINIAFKYDPIAILRIIYFARKNRIELIHTSLSKANAAGAAAAKILKIKSVATAHGLNKKSQYERSGHIICVSNAVRENLVSQGVPEERLSVIYNGIDDKRFDPEAKELLNSSVKAPEEGWINVGIISRLSREKGVDLFLEAAGLALKDNPKLRFFIAGSGTLREELEKKARDMGISSSVHFLGFVGENLVYFINELDIVVFPSLKEGLPLSLLEVMSMEKAVIVSRVGGMPEAVENGVNGYVVEKGDIIGIADKINYLSKNADEMKKIGAYARKRVLEEFNLNNMTENTEKLFMRLVSK